MGLSGLPDERLLAWLRASTQAQGVPLTVSDPAAIERVRVLLTGGEPGPRAHARSASTGHGGRPSGAPDHLDAADVHPVRGPGGGSDADVVHDGGDDRGLAGQVEGGPLLP